MRKILGIGGMPGTGKSTLMKKFLEQYQWESVEPAPLVNSMYNKKLNLYVVGKYDDPDEKFPGTDRLSMAVMPNAKKFFSETSADILFEGDRLFMPSLIEHVYTLDVVKGFIILDTSKKTLDDRYKERNSNQDEKFIKGRETKYENIWKTFSGQGGFAKITHEIPSDTDMIVKAINEFFDGSLSPNFFSVSNSLDDFFY